MVLSASEGGQALVTFLFDPLSTRESARVGAGRGTLPDGRGGPQGGASAIGHEGTVLTLPQKGNTGKGSLVSHVRLRGTCELTLFLLRGVSIFRSAGYKDSVLERVTAKNKTRSEGFICT